MLKKISLLVCCAAISACSTTSLTSYIPFVNDSKSVINLDKDKIDQKSYATAYEATVETYKGRVNQDYDVKSFTSGVNDWYLERILVPIDQIKAKLYQGSHDSSLYAYYSGVVFASDLQTNFNRLSADCWSHIDKPSLTQAVSDAMQDLQSNSTRSENDEYLVQGSEQIIKLCTK